MLFSLFGEIAFAIIGGLYVLDCWFDSFIDLLELMKDNDKDDDDKPMSDTAKRMYSWFELYKHNIYFY